jgi:hypothetical protein
MHLFDDGTGNTADSRNYFRDHRHELGDIVEAQVFFPGSGGPQPYSCVLGDSDGNKMWLSGLAAGYPGEGPRVAMEILVECGFDAEDARAVFTQSPVRLTREHPVRCQPTCQLRTVNRSPEHAALAPRQQVHAR